MKYQAKKGILEKLKTNKLRVSLLLAAGLIVGAVGADMYKSHLEDKKFEKIIEKNSPEHFLEDPDARIKERLAEIDILYPDVEQPEPEYVDKNGVEITKEEWEKQQAQNKSKEEDFER